jgi:AraC family transcriptional regulator
LRISTKRSSAETTATYLERVNLAIDHIMAHLHEPLRLRKLARIAMLSPYHFHRVFQALVGETPADFVNRLRMEKAIGLMTGGSRRGPLTPIARACGFSSLSDFSRSFKQRFGVAPSAFDSAAFRKVRGDRLEAMVDRQTGGRITRLPARTNPDAFKVRIRGVAARSVAYIRVAKPYEGRGVVEAAERLIKWAEERGLAEGQWLGYQWDNPEITPLEECGYYIGVETGARVHQARGEVGRHRFPEMMVAQVEVRGGIDLELRVLQWLYGTWLPRSGYVPDDHPGFEAFIGRPFAHGLEHFELYAQLPVKPG